MIALAVLGTCAAIAIGVIIFCVWRMKITEPEESKEGGQLEEQRLGEGYVFTGFGTKYQGKGVKQSHPATQIIPFAFNANGDGPVFDHKPGKNMRIASRHMHGVWAFHDVDPATGSPLGVNDPSPAPTSPFPTPSAASSAFTYEPQGYAPKRSNSGRTKKSFGNYYDMFGQSTTSLTQSLTAGSAAPPPAPTAPSPVYGPSSPQLPPSSPAASRVHSPPPRLPGLDFA